MSFKSCATFSGTVEDGYDRKRLALWIVNNEVRVDIPNWSLEEEIPLEHLRRLAAGCPAA
jgi:hypothetical protein